MRSGVFYFVLFALVIAADGCAAQARAAATQPVDSTGLHVPNGFLIETIASIPSARELVALPDGNLIVGTLRHDVYVVPDAEGLAASPRVFATLDDDRAAGIAFSNSRSEIYVATTNHVWVLAYPGKANARAVAAYCGRARWCDCTGDGRRRPYDDVPRLHGRSPLRFRRLFVQRNRRWWEKPVHGSGPNARRAFRYESRWFRFHATRQAHP